MIILLLFCLLFSSGLLAEPQNELSLKSSQFSIFRYSDTRYLSFNWFRTTDEDSSQEVSSQNKIFNNRDILSIDFQRSLFQFLEVLEGGVEASGGMVYYYDHDQLFIFPIKLGGTFNLNITQKPTIRPFVSGGMALWGIEGQGFSDLMVYWNVGVRISFSIFKSSLKYTLVDEYGLKDFGIMIKKSFNYSTIAYFLPNRLLISAWNIGVYFSF